MRASIFSLCLCTVPALSATAIPTLLPPRVITAKKPIPVLSSDKVTDKDIITNQYAHVAQAIANVPGVYVSQQGSEGQLSSVFIRGGNSSHTSVIVDGMCVNDPSTGLFNFAGLGTEGAATVTVLRGASVADGSPDALSGAVIIETRRGRNNADDRPVVDTRLEGGTFNTYNAEAGFEGQTGIDGQSGSSDYHVRLIRAASRGSVTTPARLHTIPRQVGADPSDRIAFVARTGTQLTDTWRLNMWNRVQETNDYSVSTYPLHANSARHGNVKSNVHRFEIETDLTRYTQKMGYSTVLNQRTNASAMTPFDPTDTTKGRADTLYFKNETRIIDTYRVLVHLTNERQEHCTQTQFLSPINHRAIAQTAGLGHTISPSKVWNAELWTRWHHHTAFKHYYSTKAKTDYTLTATRTLFLASYSTGIRAPSLHQLYAPNGGNASLNPEKSQGFDIGVEQTIVPKRLHVGATYFEQKFDALIVSVPITEVTSHFRNISKAKTYGIETFVEAKLGSAEAPPVTARIEYTFLHAKDAVLNTQLLRRPMHKLTAHLLWQVTEPWLLGIGIVHYGKRADCDAIAFNRVYRKGPTVLRLFGAYTLNPDVDFFARVENAGNSQYEYPDGFAAPGIACYAGIRLKSAVL